ncbi:MAG: TIGR03560 family F420-dependent LLM class oxidoreductase [Microbacteriaceae bacterium]|nr:TIGR03560 family F420-dependent LLM class oxidoreductase [Microbacteriaceae bacterium]
MEFCAFVEPQQGGTYAHIREFATRAEATGFDGFFRSDHLLPIGDRVAPGTTDAWTTLAGLARDTETLTLGALVSPVTFRHPSLLAVQVANVHEMSGGRAELGLGAGWYQGEHSAYGIPFPRDRFDRLEEQLEVITRLWSTDDEFSFAGEHYSLSNAPGVLAAGLARPRLIIGGDGPRRTPELASRFADEYNAFCGPDETRERIARVRAAAEKAGRDPDELRYSAAVTVVVGTDQDAVAARLRRAGIDDPADEGVAAGTPDQVAERIARYRGCGLSRIYLQFIDVTDADHVELCGERVLPALAELLADK